MARERVSSGLTFPTVIVVILAGSMAISQDLRVPLPLPVFLAHICAILCPVLMLVACQIRGRSALEPCDVRGRNPAAILEIGAVAAGFFTLLVMAYAVLTEALFRTLLWYHAATPRISIWMTGFVDLALIAAALVLAWRKSDARWTVTGLLWLVVFAAVWTAFQIPGFKVDSEGRSFATCWAAVLMLMLALAVGLFVLATGIAHRRRRSQAWPDELHLLAEAPADPASFRYSVGILSAVILLLGCVQVVLPWTVPAAIVAAIAALALAHRQWNENLADVGLALITLGIVSLFNQCFPQLPSWWTARAWAEVFNRTLLGLTVMAGVWFWFAAFWRQQLHDGRSWTTTGHMVRTAQQVGFFVAALAVLLSYHLALWPKIPYGSDDADAWRWAWGLTANGLLALVLLAVTLQTGKSTVGWLLALTLASTIMFAVIRTPEGFLGRAWAFYWPLLLAVAGGVCILISSLLSRSERWQPLFEPMYLAGVTILPLGAISGVLVRHSQLMAPWLPSVTFGTLVVVYVLAAMLTGPRTFVAVAVLCAAMAFWRLQDAIGWASIPSPYYHAMLILLSLGLWCWVADQRRPARVLRLVKWAGIALAVAVILAGWLASRR